MRSDRTAPNRRLARRPDRRRVVLEILEDRALLAAPALQLTVASPTIAENAGPSATTATVTRLNADNSLALTVTLDSTDHAAVRVPSTVVIPAGQPSATFPVDAPTGDTRASNESVTIYGQATAEAPLGIASTNFFRTSAQSFSTQAVAAQPNGAVVVAGTYYTGNSNNYYDFALARYGADGSIDTSFNGGSTLLYGVPGQLYKAQAVGVGPDGSIYVAGVFANSGDAHYNYAINRYNSTGGLLNSVTLTPTSGYYNEIWALTVQPDGNVLVGGNVNNNGTTYGDFAVTRLTPSLGLDPTFGNGGIAQTSFSGGTDRGFGLALQPDGKVVLAGTSFGGNSTSHFAVARFTARGQLDTTFGGTGKVQTDIPGDYEEARGVAIQPDGKIVVAGDVSPAGVFPPGPYDLALVRYNTDGSLDSTFGGGGIVRKDLGGNDTASAVAVEPDGMIVVGGSGISRFLPDGTLDSSMGSANIAALGFQPGGLIIAAGSNPSTFNSGSLAAYTGTYPVSAQATLTVNTTVVPTAGPDSYNVAKSTALTIAAPGVLANDSDPNGLTLTASLVTGPAHGSLTLRPDGSFTYTPAGAYLGADSFTYKASDGSYTSAPATVSLTVAGPNDPPVARDDVSTVLATNFPNRQFTTTAPGVLANDFDLNSQPLTAVLRSGPTHGTLTFQPDGSYVYTWAAGFYGADSFTYQASDGTDLSNVATVTINVYAPPVATAETYSTPENTTLTVAAPGLLANDSDPNGLPLRPVVYSGTGKGVLKVNSDGSFSYVPGTNFHGTDSFTYYVTDGKYNSGNVTDTINVTFVNQPPTARDDAYTLAEDTPLTAAAGVTSVHMTSQAGDWIGQGQSYNFTPANSTITAGVLSSGVYTNAVEVSVNTPNEFWYFHFAAPNLGRLVPGTYEAATRWPFQAPGVPGLDVSGDGRGSNTSTGRFTVTQAIYDASGNILAFAADFEQHSEGAKPALTGRVMFNSSYDKPEGVLFNDSDLEGGPITAALVTGPAHGSVSLKPDGSFNYTPVANYNGPDSFTYKANDGQLDSNLATVRLTVTPVNDPPTAGDQSVAVAQDTPTTVAFAGSDVDGDGLTYAVLTTPSHGSVKVNGDGTFTFTPAVGYNGPDSFTYKANDGTVDSNIATVTIAIRSINPLIDGGFESAPVAAGGFAYAPSGTAWSFAGYAGVSGDGSAFTGANPAAPEGSHVAFVQMTGSISQASSGWAAGSYAITFQAAQRGNQAASVEDFQVLVDGVSVGTFQPTGKAYQPYTTASFGVVAGAHTVLIQGLDSPGGDNTAFIDDIRVVAGDSSTPTPPPPAPTPPPPAPTPTPAGPLVDGGFESAPVPAGAFTYAPSGTAWSFAGYAGVSGDGSAFTGANPAAPEGSRVAFVQMTGSISQTTSGWAAGSYAITFQAAQRGNQAASVEDFQVLVDGVSVGTFQPTGKAYQPYATASFAVTAGTHTVLIQGLDGAGGDNTAFIDDIRVVAGDSSTPTPPPPPPAPTPPPPAPTPSGPIADAGFESAPVSAGGFAYSPGGSGWTFSGYAGVSGDGSAFTGANPPAPEGSRVALVQMTGSISQTTSSWAAGSYAISFQAAQRGNQANSVEDFQLTVDGIVVGTFQPSGKAYQLYTTGSFTVTAGAHTVAFRGLDSAGGDNTAFIDDVRVVAAG